MNSKYVDQVIVVCGFTFYYPVEESAIMIGVKETAVGRDGSLWIGGRVPADFGRASAPVTGSLWLEGWGPSVHDEPGGGRYVHDPS